MAAERIACGMHSRPSTARRQAPPRPTPTRRASGRGPGSARNVATRNASTASSLDCGADRRLVARRGEDLRGIDRVEAVLLPAEVAPDLDVAALRENALG